MCHIGIDRSSNSCRTPHNCIWVSQRPMCYDDSTVSHEDATVYAIGPLSGRMGRLPPRIAGRSARTQRWSVVTPSLNPSFRAFPPRDLNGRKLYDAQAPCVLWRGQSLRRARSTMLRQCSSNLRPRLARFLAVGTSHGRLCQASGSRGDGVGRTVTRIIGSVSDTNRVKNCPTQPQLK